MAVIRWEPARELQSIQQEMNRLFGTFFDPQGGPGNGGTGRRWIPAMDLVEQENEFVLRADLPGVNEDDVEVELEDNVLTISGERASEHEEKREGYHRIERSSGRFSRSLTLPEGVDPDSIHARFENGVLELTVPKPAQRKPRRVAISVGERPAVEATASDRAQHEERPAGASAGKGEQEAGS
ncbi:MAG TPA: Hsp20/alpha crystallin family protein [Solirubrobacteraceae bacterium]|nr:Hsp20/alpha crystallin family protein [Solirubrobacteraceae bacterium]